MAATLIASAGVFTTAHIAFTGAVSGVLALAGALLVDRRRGGLAEKLLIGVLAAAAVFLWRKSANMPQLNNDGLQGFSANDWLAPVVVYVMLGLFGAIRRPGDDGSFGRARAFAVIAAFAVNVITI